MNVLEMWATSASSLVLHNVTTVRSDLFTGVLLIKFLRCFLPALQSSNAKLDMWFARKGSPKTIVATGFIAKNPSGQVRSLELASSSQLSLAATPCYKWRKRGQCRHTAQRGLLVGLVTTAHTWLARSGHSYLLPLWCSCSPP